MQTLQNLHTSCWFHILTILTHRQKSKLFLNLIFVFALLCGGRKGFYEGRKGLHGTF